jgi:purine-binding chemotaxis protein CheW
MRRDTAEMLADRREINGPGWLLCRAASVICALPVAHVVEVMRVVPLDQVAGAPPYVLGLGVIRGSAVPVIDLGLLVSNQASSPARLITIKTATHTVAVAVEAVFGVSAIAAELLGRLPPLVEQDANASLAAIGVRDRALVMFLKAGRLVPDSVLDGLSAEGVAA